MQRATRRERTLARTAEVRGYGFFHGADVTLRFSPAEAGTGVVFVRTDLPDRPAVPAHIDNVIPAQRRTAIRQGAAVVEMIEHVMAALAGIQIDNCIVQIDAGECPGCDGSSQAFVEALDHAGITEQGRMRQAIVLERAISVRDGDAILAAHPAEVAGGLTLFYHLDFGSGSPIAAQSFCLPVSPATFRDEVAASRTFLLEGEANALRAAGIGARATPADLLIFGQGGVIGNSLRYSDECVRHKILDMVGDLALLGCDLQGFVVAHRSGHQTNHALARRLLEIALETKAAADVCRAIDENGVIDVERIMNLLPHRYPFLLIDRVLDLDPGQRVVAIKNVTINEPFFQGHWPARPIMPGVLIVEALAQAAGVLIAASVETKPHQVALITSIDGVKLRRKVIPGDQLRLEAVSRNLKPNAACVSALAKVGDTVVAEAKLRFVIVDADRPVSSPERENSSGPAIRAARNGRSPRGSIVPPFISPTRGSAPHGHSDC
jgi:UDP-3-O-[3-hydroxymyristoyl] N-acetylglucosamine deacetylase/3-hydroxyacyl-[acyl-carrier-protein] dehydratase